MSFFTLDAELVDALHDEVLNPGELLGRARDKSLDGALARVDNRLAYGMIEDAFDLAAMYAVAIATGHCFNDANKRTAFRAMDAALAFNGWRSNGIRSKWATSSSASPRAGWTRTPSPPGCGPRRRAEPLRQRWPTRSWNSAVLLRLG